MALSKQGLLRASWNLAWPFWTGDEKWSARAYDETLVIPAGATVDVIEIEGATALVYPRE